MLRMVPLPREPGRIKAADGFAGWILPCEAGEVARRAGGGGMSAAVEHFVTTPTPARADLTLPTGGRVRC
jgi:hypothetical protein